MFWKKKKSLRESIALLESRVKLLEEKQMKFAAEQDKEERVTAKEIVNEWFYGEEVAKDANRGTP